MSRLKRLYESFLSSGELLEIFPELDHEDEAGNSWSRDKDKFTELQSEMETTLDFDTDIEDIDPDEYLY